MSTWTCFYTYLGAENLLAQPPFQEPVPGGWGPSTVDCFFQGWCSADSQMQETPRTRGRTRRECWTRGTRGKRPWCGALRGGHASAAAVWRHYFLARGPMITRTPLFKTQWHLSRSYSSPETQRVWAARTVHLLVVASCTSWFQPFNIPHVHFIQFK